MRETSGTDDPSVSSRRRRLTGLLAGPGIALVMLLVPVPGGLQPAAWHTAAVGVLMAIWWASEALPVGATALVPLVLFPLLGVFDIGAAAAPFANPLIYLFLGGFFIALALQRWNLHLRIALLILPAMASSPKALIAGFMLVTAFLSMWVSNTATTIMMLPVAVAVVALLGKEVQGTDTAFARALMLSIAYAASVGGLATLVGTPPNAILAAYILDTFGFSIGFAQWMLLGVPVSLSLLAVIWFTLTRHSFDGASSGIKSIADHLARERAALGGMSVPEKRVLGVFAVTAFLWILRPLLSARFGMSGMSDSVIAVFGALLMFVIPADWKQGAFLLNWAWARRAPWDVLLLFGGGLSLARAMTETGLAEWIGEALIGLGAMPVAVAVLGIVALVIFMTELTSNTATTIALLPVITSLAQVSGLDPLQLAVPAALAASCAFMLPVATPPNAIVFGAGHVSTPEMMRAGFVLNLVGMAVISVAVLLLFPRVFDLP